MKTKPITVRFAPETKEALGQAAETEMRTISAMIELLVVRGLRDMGYLEKSARRPHDERNKAGKGQKP